MDTGAHRLARLAGQLAPGSFLYLPSLTQDYSQAAQTGFYVLSAQLSLSLKFLLIRFFCLS